MTDKEKVIKMFEIRKKEMPDHKDAAERIETILDNVGTTAYHALLKMYNERYGGKK